MIPSHNANGRATEVDTPDAVNSRGSIPTPDEMESIRSALTRQACEARTARIMGTIRLVRLYEEIFGGPVRRNVLARTRNGDGEDLAVCPRCLEVMTAPERCSNCGRHADA